MEDKYFGIYRGRVIDNEDPLKRRRVKLQVPQVLGEAVTDWAWPAPGVISQWKHPYGTYTTTTDQYATAVSTEKLITHENTEDALQTYAEGSRIYVEESGDYFIQFATTFLSSSSSAQTVDIWFKLNGQNIPRSSTQFIMAGNPNQRTVTKGGIIDLEAGDYVETAFAVSNVGVHIASIGATSVHPATAGSVFTLHLVAHYKPKPDTGVWVMFEGGDPNFPIWTGAF